MVRPQERGRKKGFGDILPRYGARYPQFLLRPSPENGEGVTTSE